MTRTLTIIAIIKKCLNVPAGVIRKGKTKETRNIKLLFADYVII